MKQFIILVLIIFSFTSCSVTNSGTLETSVRISVLDSNKTDLLAPDSQHELAINEKDIEIYYVINNEEKLAIIANPKVGSSHFIYYDDKNEHHWLEVKLNYDEHEDYPTTIVDWGNGAKRDTIKCRFEYSKSVIIENMWLNGELLNWTEFINIRQ